MVHFTNKVNFRTLSLCFFFSIFDKCVLQNFCAWHVIANQQLLEHDYIECVVKLKSKSNQTWKFEHNIDPSKREKK